VAWGTKITNNLQAKKKPSIETSETRNIQFIHESSFLDDHVFPVPLHLRHIPVRRTISTTPITSRKDERVSGREDEPSREPVGTARSKIEHRRSGKRDRIGRHPSKFGVSVRASSAARRRARFGRQARGDHPRRERECVDAWVLCVPVAHVPRVN
jgi:hypothetical protein